MEKDTIHVNVPHIVWYEAWYEKDHVVNSLNVCINYLKSVLDTMEKQLTKVESEINIKAPTE